MALVALLEPDPGTKTRLAQALHAQVCSPTTGQGPGIPLPIAPERPACAGELPGRPALPRLVHPARVPRRSPH